MIPPSQKKFFTSLCLSVILLILFVVLVVFAWFDKIKETSYNFLTNQKVLVELENKESLLKQLKEEYRQNEKELTALAGAFLDSEEIVGLITTLETIAKQTGNVYDLKPISTPSSSENNASFLSFQISLWGDFPSLLSFIANLENNPYPPYRLIEIENLQIKRLSESDLSRLSSTLKEGDLETTINIKIYTSIYSD